MFAQVMAVSIELFNLWCQACIRIARQLLNFIYYKVSMLPSHDNPLFRILNSNWIVEGVLLSCCFCVRITGALVYGVYSAFLWSLRLVGHCREAFRVLVFVSIALLMFLIFLPAHMLRDLLSWLMGTKRESGIIIDPRLESKVVGTAPIQSHSDL